jgi:hypothetical protein
VLAKCPDGAACWLIASLHSKAAETAALHDAAALFKSAYEFRHEYDRLVTSSRICTGAPAARSYGGSGASDTRFCFGGRFGFGHFAAPGLNDFVGEVQLFDQLGVALGPIDLIPEQMFLDGSAAAPWGDAAKPDKPTIGFAGEDEAIALKLQVSFVNSAAARALTGANKRGGVRVDFFGGEDLRVVALSAGADDSARLFDEIDEGGGAEARPDAATEKEANDVGEWKPGGWKAGRWIDRLISNHTRDVTAPQGRAELGFESSTAVGVWLRVLNEL